MKNDTNDTPPVAHPTTFPSEPVSIDPDLVTELVVDPEANEEGDD